MLLVPHSWDYRTGFSALLLGLIGCVFKKMMIKIFTATLLATLPVGIVMADSISKNNLPANLTATVGVSHLQQFLSENLTPKKIIRLDNKTTLIFTSVTQKDRNLMKRDFSGANAIQLDFNEIEVLSAISLIRFDH